MATEEMRSSWREAAPRTVVVDGHEFHVRPRPRERGVYDFDWKTGPSNYGFTSAHYSGEAMTPAEIEDEIRHFLGLVNPETGYID